MPFWLYTKSIFFNFSHSFKEYISIFFMFDFYLHYYHIGQGCRRTEKLRMLEVAIDFHWKGEVKVDDRRRRSYNTGAARAEMKLESWVLERSTEGMYWHYFFRMFIRVFHLLA